MGERCKDALDEGKAAGQSVKDLHVHINLMKPLGFK